MKEEMIAQVKALVEAPSCYEGLKELGQEWLKAVGSDKEKELTEKFMEELEADVLSIDDVLAFFESEAGEKMFGAETVAAWAEHAREVKANSGKWCDCPACAAGRAILDMKK